MAASLYKGKTAINFKVFLAAVFFFAQLAGVAHAHHEHEAEHGPTEVVQCTLCLVKSVNDDDDTGLLPSAAHSAQHPACAFATGATGGAPASQTINRPSARGPPRN